MENSNDTIRIAHVIGKWVGGGVEAVVMNYYRNIDHNKIQFDFICDEDSTNIPYDEIEKLGGKVILIPPYQKLISYHKKLKKILKDGNYKIVHSHINTLSVFSLFAAKCAGVPVRIAHSHSTTNPKEKKKNFLKQILRPFSKIFATEYMCCSELAGRWLFGNKEYDKGNVYLLNNAIDLEKFKYDENVRKEKRKELNIDDDTLVIGHVGRFVEQKNHEFLIEVFYEYRRKNRKAKLLLIGQGPLENFIKEKAKKLKIEDSILFLEQRNDVNELYQVFDIFIFPSLYEGLGMVLIEAQCSGCFCIASDKVPEVVKVTPNIKFISLKEEKKEWCNIIENIQYPNRKEINLSELNKKYDVKNEAKKLENIYYNKYMQDDSIELFGIPACGKSFFANKTLMEYININEKCIYNKNRLVRNIRKVFNVLEIVLKHFKLFCKGIILMNQINIRNKLKMYLYFFSTLNICIKSNKQKRKCVIEEGMIQVLWGICYNSNYTEDFIKEYINEFKKYFAEKIIVIDINIDIIKERLLERKKIGGSELEHDIKKNINVIYRAESIKNDIIKQIEKEKINIVFVKEY